MDSQRTQRVGEARQRALSFHFASKQSQDKSSLLPSLHAPSTVGFRSTFACWNYLCLQPNVHTTYRYTYRREFFRADLLACDGGRQSPAEKTSRRPI